jgi:peptidoglycan hydrolase CwlO-like protein
MAAGSFFAVPATATDASPDALQQQIDSDNEQIAKLTQKIAIYQQQLAQIGSDKKTLQAAIHALDLERSRVQAQVAVTQRQINTTRLQIKQLGGQIQDTQQTIAMDQAAIVRYLQIVQRIDGESVLVRALVSDNLTQFWKDISATLQAEKATRRKTQELQTHKDGLANIQAAAQEKQDALTAQQQSLTAQQQSLVTTERSKTQLLAQTKAQESQYQKLLAQAQAQLESFSSFTKNAGGANLVGNQTICDGWGCYYNQRDEAWGNASLNGTKYTLASDGCLVTSMAMVMTHYGYKRVTPVTINSNPGNFASYFPAFLLNTITVAGVTAERKAAAIDAQLAGGDPVVIGVKAYGGTHFLVLVSGSRGKYLMRDPYIPGGKDIDFSANYSLKKIFSIAKVQISE